MIAMTMTNGSETLFEHPAVVIGVLAGIVVLMMMMNVLIIYELHVGRSVVADARSDQLRAELELEKSKRLAQEKELHRTLLEHDVAMTRLERVEELVAAHEDPDGTRFQVEPEDVIEAPWKSFHLGQADMCMRLRAYALATPLPEKEEEVAEDAD